MKNFLATISLKRIFSLFTIITIFLLFIVIFFAGKQYFLYRHCINIVDSSQQLLFHYTGIKEHINETLLNDKLPNVSEINKEIQGLDTHLQGILEDILIPEEFKLNFISQLDLVNVTVALRNLQNITQDTKNKETTALSIQLRSINTKLNSFNQLISRYTQTQLLGLHKALVGLLAIVIALVSLMLFIVNQYITAPLLHACRSLSPDDSTPVTLFSFHKIIETLAAGSSGITTNNSERNSRELTSLYRYSSIGHLLGGLSHELTNISNGTINYTQAVLDLSADSNLDEDSTQLLQKLYVEEKKMSQLLSNMITFTSGSESGQAKIMTADDFFEQIIGLTQSTFKNENIQIQLQLNTQGTMLKNHVNDLQLIVLSALQNSRTALNKKFSGSRPGEESKKIAIRYDEQDLEENGIIIEILDNGIQLSTPTPDTKTTISWPNMVFCKDFMQTLGGSLSLNRKSDQSNSCIITLPLTSKK